MKAKRLSILIIIAICLFTWVLGFAYQTIRPGEKIKEVKNIQQALEYLGYNVKIDGSYGPMTEQAIKDFQVKHNLTADGIAGDKTLKKLFSLAPQFDFENAGNNNTNTTNLAAPKGMLKLGDEASAVATLQKRLIELGYPVSRADAVFGRGTREAVRLFQEQNGLKITGIADEKTMEKLFSNTAQKYAKTLNTQAPNPRVQQSLAPQATESINYPSGKYKIGDNVSAVGQIQERLKALNYPIGKVDMVYGKSTKEAVILFQRLNGLVEDGIAGQGTLKALFSSNAKAYTVQTQSPQVSLAPIATPAPKLSLGKAVVSTGQNSKLNFRTSANSKEKNIIGKLSNGTVVEVLQKGSTWTNIALDNQVGYVMTKYLSFNVNPSPSPNVVTLAPQINIAPQVSLAPIVTPEPEIETLRQGMTGENVLKMQKRLVELEYSLNTNSVYDASTKQAVTNFQTQNGLKADGIAGKETQSILYSSVAQKANTATVALRELRLNSTDDNDGAVTKLQNRLKELKYTVKVNGTFDVTTHDAVVLFQSINGLSTNGRASSAMQKLLYSNEAKANNLSGGGTSTGIKPSGNPLLLHWFKDVKPSISNGQILAVYHPASGKSFNLRAYSSGRHLDAEPQTLNDTLTMNSAFGPPSWNINPVYVKLPNGNWTLATMHNRPHLSGAISDNGFDGHLCVHFLRDMDEAQKNDPNYGVQNQKAIRDAWKRLTGEVIE